MNKIPFCPAWSLRRFSAALLTLVGVIFLAGSIKSEVYTGLDGHPFNPTVTASKSKVEFKLTSCGCSEEKVRLTCNDSYCCFQWGIDDWTIPENDLGVTVTPLINENAFIISGGTKKGEISLIIHWYASDFDWSAYGGHTYEKSGTIEVQIIVKDPDDNDDDEGCSSCGDDANGPLGKGRVKPGGVDFSASLGRTVFGKDSPKIGLKSDVAGLALTQPASLNLEGNLDLADAENNKLDIVWRVDPVTRDKIDIQQIMTREGLMNVTRVLTDGICFEYSLNFYSPDSVEARLPGDWEYSDEGVYTLKTGAEPMVTWTIKNPNNNQTGNYNQLQITESRGSTQRTSTYTFDPQYNKWELLAADGIRRNVTWSEVNGNVTYKHNEVWTGSTKCESSVRKKYLTENGRVLLKEIVKGTDTLAQTTFSHDSAGRTARVDYPDGRWEYREYAPGNQDDGRVVKRYESYLDYAPPAGVPNPPTVDHCKVIEYEYNNYPDVTRPSKTVVKVPVLEGSQWDMKEVSRTFWSTFWTPDGDSEMSEQATVAEASSGDPTNIKTQTFFVDVQDSNSGTVKRPSKVLHPDGLTTTYSYTWVSGTSPEAELETVKTTGKQDEYGVFLDAMETTTRQDIFGRVTYEIQKKVENGLAGVILSHKVVTYSTSGEDRVETDLLTGLTTTVLHDCCGLAQVQTPDGRSTVYGYDELHRKTDTFEHFGNDIVTFHSILDVKGREVERQRISGGTPASTITLGRSEFDVLGRQTKQWNALNAMTTFSETMVDGHVVRTTTYPDLGTRIETMYLDGSLKSVTGTAVAPVYYEYGVDSIGTFTKEIKGSASGTEWVKTYSDMLGRAIKTVYADNASSQTCYNSKGQLWKQADPDGVTTLYAYNDLGEREYTIMAVKATTKAIANYDDLLTGLATLKSGTDRITRTTNSVLAAESQEGGKPDRTQVETYAWVDGSSTPRLLSRSESAVSGLQSWQTVWRVAGNDATKAETVSVTTYDPVNGTRTQATTAPDNTTTVSVSSYGRPASVTRYDTSSAQVGRTTYSYDVHGRQQSVTDDRNGTTTYGYNNADQVVSATTPAPAPGLLPLVTRNTYNNMGRVTAVTQPDGTVVNNVYFQNGQLQKTWGSRTYPVEYTYDYAGRMKTMKTWQNFNEATGSGTSGYAITTWNYDSCRGWLMSKDYPDANNGNAPATGTSGPNYTYTPGGRLKTRAWLRTGTGGKVLTTYKYGFDDSVSDNESGDLTKVEYSNDPADTPCVTTTYDRMGRRKTVTVEPTLLQAGITTTYAYNDAGQVLTETMSGGIMNGIIVSRSYNNSLRMDGLNVLGTPTPYDVDYGYDTAGRLQTVVNGDDRHNSATYAYHDNSPLIQTVTFKQGTTNWMTTTRNYDHINRLTGISSVSYPTTPPTVPSSTVNSSSYQLNSASQRVRNELPDGSYWEYTYDTMGQVKSGKHYWADGTPVAGQQYEYAFDDIGNRITNRMGGDNAGANLQSSRYTTDRLNRYSIRTVPPYADITGIANPAASVTVNSQTATRKGEYFWKALSTPNNNSQTHAPWYDQITINSTYGGGQSETGYLFVPYSPEAFSYDDDGNLTQDGRWIYTWDAENRLIRMVAATAFGPPQWIEFGYDSMGRRISKKVWPNTQRSGNPDVDQLFVYDGWNLLAILNSSFSLLNSFTWGLDLSGSMQGAGGVGGLLWASEINGSGVTTDSHYAAYDGNGNVTSLTKASDGTESARYEYGPFGEVIRMTGAYAKSNPFRFSTKFTDDESGLLYYGYRYYNPSTGRWVSRDPLGERGGNNLYSFVKNDGINKLDYYGLIDLWSFFCSDECSLSDKPVLLKAKANLETKYGPKGIQGDTSILTAYEILDAVDAIGSVAKGVGLVERILNLSEEVIDDNRGTGVIDVIRKYLQTIGKIGSDYEGMGWGIAVETRWKVCRKTMFGNRWKEEDANKLVCDRAGDTYGWLLPKEYAACSKAMIACMKQAANTPPKNDQ